MSGARLFGVDLSGADLRGANLEQVTLGCSTSLRATYPEYTEGELRQCPNLKDIKWDKYTNWKGIQVWGTVENIPPELEDVLKEEEAS